MQGLSDCGLCYFSNKVSYPNYDYQRRDLIACHMCFFVCLMILNPVYNHQPIP